MTNLASQIPLLLFGLGLIFFGLPLFRGTLHLFGFIVGAIYGLFFFSYFAISLSLTPVLVLFLVIAVGLVGGLLGMALANFANSIFVFIAGGLVALMITKLFAGFPIENIVEAFKTGQFRALFQLQMLDLLWFVIGGGVFVMAMDSVMTVALVMLGTILLYRAMEPMNLMEPRWVIPVAVGVIGLMVQESLRHRALNSKRVIVLHEKVRKH
jgi:hypothetical protein